VVFERHQAQFNVFVGRMTGDAAFVGEEDKGLAVGRKVRNQSLLSSLVTCS